MDRIAIEKDHYDSILLEKNKEIEILKTKLSQLEEESIDFSNKYDKLLLEITLDRQAKDTLEKESNDMKNRLKGYDKAFTLKNKENEDLRVKLNQLLSENEDFSERWNKLNKEYNALKKDTEDMNKNK